MNIAHNLGVQSYCFREFKDNQQVVAMVKECGIEIVELSGVHADFTDVKSFENVLNVYHNAGIAIRSFGVVKFKNDKKTETRFFECAKIAEIKVIPANFAVDSAPGSFRTAEKLADKYDINLAIHNHGSRHWLGSMEMLSNIFKNTSKRIGLCLDTAWALDSRENPLVMAETFADRLYGVHLKDFLFEKTGNPKDVIIGQGNLNLAEFLNILNKNKFDGPTIIESEGNSQNPVPAVIECVKAVKNCEKK